MLKHWLPSLVITAVAVHQVSTRPHPFAVQVRAAPPQLCMNPNNQPQLVVRFSPLSASFMFYCWLIAEIQINSNCPSSLTSPSTCSKSSAYKNNCLAYCEQFLYWFLGPEVPYPNSNCQADEACTFSGAKSLAITNSYSFSAGLTGSPGGEASSIALELAFNAGATYTYSNTTTTTQTLTESRPMNANSSCGYWTFLPYYVS